MSAPISGTGARAAAAAQDVGSVDAADAPPIAEQAAPGAPASQAQTTLRAASQAMSVAALQARLQVDGHGTGLEVPSGVDGHATGVDAPARPQGYALLDAARAGRYLRSGSSGEEVKALQRALRQAGADVPESGAFDARTLEAVKKFQRDSGCAVDGVVGPETLGALDRRLGVAGSGGGGGAPAPAGGGGAAAPANGGGGAPSPVRPSTEPPGPAPSAAPVGPSGGGGAAAIGSIPPRPEGAETGSAFMERTRGMNPAQREAAILSEIEKGNIPDFLRQMKPVTVSFTGADGKPHTATYNVMPDYLAIGSGQDFVRIPMNPLTAQKLADRFGCSLPTSKMVDDIYAQAQVKLAPSPQPPGAQMMSNDYYMRHQRTIEGQLGGRHGELVAGNKKDLVLSNKLAEKPGAVCIYGWHQPNGKPIQGTSTVHENTYADYSHGTRLVSGTIMVDGKPMALADALRDPNLAKGLSSEGPLRVTRQPGV